MDYYKKAIDIIEEDHYPVIFSDDINWCKNNLDMPDAFYSDGNDQFVDMCLMSNCDSHIIANSSFSWWGAWLGCGIKQKTVVAPQKWFGPKLEDKNTNDIYCEGWFKA